MKRRHLKKLIKKGFSPVRKDAIQPQPLISDGEKWFIREISRSLRNKKGDLLEVVKSLGNKIVDVYP